MTVGGVGNNATPVDAATDEEGEDVFTDASSGPVKEGDEVTAMDSTTLEVIIVEEEGEDIDMDRIDEELREAEKEYEAALAQGVDDSRRAQLTTAAAKRRNEIGKKKMDHSERRLARRSLRRKIPTAKALPALKAGITKSAAGPARRQWWRTFGPPHGTSTVAKSASTRRSQMTRWTCSQHKRC